MSKKIYKKIIAITIVAIALAVAILSITYYKASMAHIISIIRFFDIMIPILAVGALVKYLICGGGCDCCCKDQNSCSKH